MTFFSLWLERWRKRNVAAVGYRFGDAPTVDEVAAGSVAVPRTEFAHASLDAAQIRRLLQLVEECGEVAHAALKALERGYDERSRGGRGMSRRVLIEYEIGHLSAATAELYAAGDLRLCDVRVWQERRQCQSRRDQVAAAARAEESSGQ